MELINDPEFWQDKETVFNLLFFHASALFVLCVFVDNKLKARKLEYFNGTIIGYQHKLAKSEKKDPYGMYLEFFPIIKFDHNGEERLIKNLYILKPEGHKISGNLYKNDRYISATGKSYINTLMAFMLMLLCIITAMLTNFYIFKTYLTYMVVVPLILAFINMCYGTYKEYKELESFSDLTMYIWPKRPADYDLMTEQDFKNIKNKDMCTYEETMAYYYYQQQHGKIYAVLAFFVAFLGLLIVLDMIFLKSETLLYIISLI